MRKFLQALGVLGLVAWTLGGVVVWKVVGDRVHVTVVDGDDRAGDERMLLLEDRLGALETDLRTLASTLGENFELLAARVDDDAESRAARIAGDLRSLRETIAARGAGPAGALEPELARRLDRLDAALARLAGAPGAAALDGPPGHAGHAGHAGADEHATPLDEGLALPVPPAEPAPAPPQDEAPTAPKKSFLAFRLPSDDFAFDQLRHYVLVPSLSRVGFDAKSTLHDFSGVSTAVGGELDADLSRPATASGFVRVTAESLRTGLDERDEALDEHLAVGEHPELEFRLESFEPGTIDVPGQRLQGLAKGRMTIRGVSREVAMPVHAYVDDSRRLVIEGEMPLRLPDYEVPVPNKLGVISMEEEVKVWIALRARSAPAGN